MKVLAFTTVFPNPAQPVHGVFVYHRLRHAAHGTDIRVVAPVGWQRRRRIPRQDHVQALPTTHPTFWYVPGIAKCIDGVLLFLSSVLTVARLWREDRFDLIDAHFAYPDGFAAILLGRWFRRPVVITMRGNEIDYQRYVCRRAAIRWALRRAHLVIAVSEQLGDLAEHLGVVRDRIRVIPNGVDAERFTLIERSAARSQLGIPEHIRLIVSVGHLVPRKGFHDIIESVRSLRERGEDALLAIVGGPGPGSGEYPAVLSQLVRRLQLETQVRFVGSVSHSDVVTWLNAADVFVLASAREGSANVLLEALACGCPVVAAAVGEAPSIVTPAGGIVVERADDVEMLARAISQALHTPWCRDAVRSTVQNRTWQGVAAQVRECWESVLHSSVDVGGRRERSQGVCPGAV